MAEVNTDKLFNDFQAVVRDAEALLKATTGLAGDKVQEVRSRTEETVKQARASIDELQNDTIRRAKELAGATEGFVRDNPWQAVGVAAGLGVLIGLLMSRRT